MTAHELHVFLCRIVFPFRPPPPHHQPHVIGIRLMREAHPIVTDPISSRTHNGDWFSEPVLFKYKSSTPLPSIQEALFRKTRSECTELLLL